MEQAVREVTWVERPACVGRGRGRGADAGGDCAEDGHGVRAIWPEMAQGEGDVHGGVVVRSGEVGNGCKCLTATRYNAAPTL